MLIFLICTYGIVFGGGDGLERIFGAILGLLIYLFARIGAWWHHGQKRQRKLRSLPSNKAVSGCVQRLV
jgi:hypothetical protein